ncbi:glycosyltransferase family 2 protein [Myxococcota bacterium]|nr:glycosyltransferase family 2 protein [Myxococcota bacterium]
MSGIGLSVVVPVYGSEDCVQALVDAIDEVLEPTGLGHEIILVNDASQDGSWQAIQEVCSLRRHVVGVDLRRNFGQDNAILAGLRLARGEAIAIMDDDLQHDPADLPRMLEELSRGYDVVYAKFRRKKQARWKNAGSWFNGKVAEWVIDKPSGIYLSPYKVVRSDVAREICRYSGPVPYVDGLLLQVTSRLSSIDADHHDRFAGTGHYTFFASVAVWLRLAFSFSVLPLRLVSLLGVGLAGVAMVLVLATVYYRAVYPDDFGDFAVGWASLIVTQMFVGGIQMVFFGVIGEYVGKSYLTLTNKPQAMIAEVLNGGPSDASSVAKNV